MASRTIGEILGGIAGAALAPAAEPEIIAMSGEAGADFGGIMSDALGLRGRPNQMQLTDYMPQVKRSRSRQARRARRREAHMARTADLRRRRANLVRARVGSAILQRFRGRIPTRVGYKRRHSRRRSRPRFRRRRYR